MIYDVTWSTESVTCQWWFKAERRAALPERAGGGLSSPRRQKEAGKPRRGTKGHLEKWDQAWLEAQLGNRGQR